MGRKVLTYAVPPKLQTKLPVTCEGDNGPSRLAYSKKFQFEATGGFSTGITCKAST